MDDKIRLPENIESRAQIVCYLEFDLKLNEAENNDLYWQTYLTLLKALKRKEKKIEREILKQQNNGI